MTTTTKGGARPGAGAPLKYGEPLKAITFRIPESKIPEFKKYVKEFLTNLKK